MPATLSYPRLSPPHGTVVSMNQEETMIKQVARERGEALTRTLRELLTDLEIRYRTGPLPRLDSYWRGPRVVLIDDREAVREQHERLKSGRSLREWAISAKAKLLKATRALG